MRRSEPERSILSGSFLPDSGAALAKRGFLCYTSSILWIILALFVPERGEDMERITSRKTPLISHIRALLMDRSYRREKGEYVCDGVKLLVERVHADALAEQ